MTVKIWVEKAFSNDPTWPAQYVLSEVDNHWDEPIEMPDGWWEQYKNVAHLLSEMQLQAAKKAGYEDE